MRAAGTWGKQVAEKWIQAGDRVFAITRNQSRCDELSQLGIRPIVWDWLDGSLPLEQEAWCELRERERAHSSTLLMAVSHAAQPGIPHSESHTRGLANLKRALQSINSIDEFEWIYLSTTGVFRQGGSGDWVDEESEVLPVRPGAIAAWKAEQWLTNNLERDDTVILRPAGIYGPGRVPRWQAIRDRLPLESDPESFLNLIHIDDLTAIIVRLSIQKANHGLYCVSDGTPVMRRDYYEFISRFGNWPRPVFQPMESTLPDPPRSRSEGNKRIRNERIQREFSFRFLFPSYQEGLRSLFTMNES